jgi:hypothetical protein
VDLVGTGLDGADDDGAAGTAEFGWGHAGVDFELLSGIDGRKEEDGVDQAVVVVHAVEDVVVGLGAAPLVNTTDPTMGETISGQQVTELPLNGRNFTNLALLAPGVTPGAYGDASSGVNNNTETLRYNESGGASLSVNGLRLFKY